MKKLTITSSNKHDNPDDIVNKLEKAISAIQSHQPQRHFTDPFLKATKSNADTVVDKLFSNMLTEIQAVLTG